jgi:hypothetical protein
MFIDEPQLSLNFQSQYHPILRLGMLSTKNLGDLDQSVFLLSNLAEYFTSWNVTPKYEQSQIYKHDVVCSCETCQNVCEFASSVNLCACKRISYVILI